MKQFTGYDLIEKISESQRSLIYRALKKDTGETCVLKVLKTKHPSLSDIARFRHEYEIIKNSDIEGIIKTRDIVIEQNTIAIELENFKGQRLKDLISTPWMSIENLLDAAIQTASALGSLHKNGISHRDIKPQNILVNPESGELRITDFGISTMVTHENEELYNPGVIEGTLFYMSPEQTGRMNRSVDYRTDIYSAGITLYEMAAGRPPFVSDDPMEIIHSHIARTPDAPSEINTGIPKILSSIIMRCLEKNAEQRYQNAFGLKADLLTCLENFRKSGEFPEFTIGLKDISDRFNIPQRLYGRDDELKILLDAFDRVSRGAKELTLVAGSPGIGKSALIEEVQKPIVEKRGYYIFGKYDQFKRDVPYSAFIQAFQNLIRQLLTESTEKIEDWKRKISEALGPNGKIITDAIPSVEFIIGEQPLLPELGPEESQNRFTTVFKNFIGVFARREHPLVIFLDDLQWADAASLNMFEKGLLDRELRHLYIIGAYRDNEIGQAHPFIRALDSVKEGGVTINTIYLGSVDLIHVEELIIDSLKCDSATARPLAELIHGKTDGNPFFFIQFMKSLYDGRMLRYSTESGWEWNIKEIRDMQVTENVLELMAGKISSLSPASIEALKVCACIGNRFNLETLSIVYDKPIDEILFDLSDALMEGMVFFTGDSYRFLHDRIQEAAYSLIPAEERPGLHYRIGTYVLNNTTEDSLKDMVFYIVNHLNIARDLMKTPEEKKRLLELNRTAGKKAKNSTAYESAAKYFEIAILMLPDDSWTSDYQNSFDIRMNLAECAHLNRDFDRAEALFVEMTSGARDDLDRARIYNLRVMMIASLGRHKEAVAVGIEGLKIFGIKVTSDPGQVSIGLAAVKTKILIGRRSIESLENLPEISDEKNLLLMRYMMNLTTTAYFYNSDLSILLAVKMLELTLKHGLSKYSAYACVVFGAISGAGLGDYDTGYKFGTLAMRLNERFNNAELRSRLHLLFGLMIGVWKDPLKDNLVHARKGLAHSVENGDVNYAIFTAQAILILMIPMGVNLDLVYKEYASHIDFLMELRDPGAVNYLISVRQYVQALKGETSAPASMDDANFTEEAHIASMEKDGIPIVIQRHHLLKARLLYFFGRYDEAMKSSDRSEKLIKSSLGQIVVAEHYFFRAMILAALYSSMSPLKKAAARFKIKKILSMFKKWNLMNPATFSDKELMLRGELARIKGDDLRALSLYTDAAAAALSSGFPHYSALANELAANMCKKTGLDRAAEAHLAEAAALYDIWGAAAKVRQLGGLSAAERSAAFEETGSISLHSTTPPTAGSGISASDRLDIATVMKASHAISGEIQLEKLLSRMILLLMENAGAERGVILLSRKGALFIEAEGFPGGRVEVLKSIPVESENSAGASVGAETVPITVINYASRTGEAVVAGDLSTEPMFSADPYVTMHKTRSALCVPIYQSGNLMALLYLENNLVAGAFTPERVEMMKMLSSQIAISIDNANLYSNMEKMVADRTARLKKSLDDVRALKDQQDGDYFLTSLLLEPLNACRAAVPGVNIDFVVKSKKKFTFKKWNRELGGDICIAYDLILKGEKYPVFLNADAMGKSIQGAGGAIVLGAVFKAMVERTNSAPSLGDQSPKEWIIGALKELQAVFESFDCSMMISLVLGLVDVRTGRMYFINAEHPFTVLYRNGKALFLEKELTIRKLGIPELILPDKVYAVQLKPGDIIIAGSDGRDDILLESGRDGGLVMNEDENLFLRSVEKAGGSLAGIEEEIFASGAQTDDLSLLRIEFTG